MLLMTSNGEFTASVALYDLNLSLLDFQPLISPMCPSLNIRLWRFMLSRKTSAHVSCKPAIDLKIIPLLGFSDDKNGISAVVVVVLMADTLVSVKPAPCQHDGLSPTDSKNVQWRIAVSKDFQSSKWYTGWQSISQRSIVGGVNRRLLLPLWLLPRWSREHVRNIPTLWQVLLRS